VIDCWDGTQSCVYKRVHVQMRQRTCFEVVRYRSRLIVTVRSYRYYLDSMGNELNFTGRITRGKEFRRPKPQ
jgi:hypothetical protein